MWLNGVRFKKVSVFLEPQRFLVLITVRAINQHPKLWKRNIICKMMAAPK